MPRDEMFNDQARRVYQGPCDRDLTAAEKATLQRYHPTLRRRLRRFALMGRPCADLLASFPAAATLIATMEAGPEATGLAVARAKRSAPLPAIAEALELPLWIRKLPPEAFGQDPIGRVMGGPEFARRIANHLPRRQEAAMWRAWVLEALRLGDEPFALWIAAQPIFHRWPLPAEALEPLAAYAFASQRAAAARDPLLPKRWGAKKAFGAAVRDTGRFLQRVIHERCLIGDCGGDWDAPGKVSGFQILPLTTEEELVREGDAMDNCMATYVGPVERGECLIYSVRWGRRSVADIEIRPRAAAGEFYVAQFEGPGNSEPGHRVRRAVDRWVNGLGQCPLNKSGLLRWGRLNKAKWRSEWADFILAHPAAGSLWKEAEPEAAMALLAERLRWLDHAARIAAGPKLGEEDPNEEILF